MTLLAQMLANKLVVEVRTPTFDEAYKALMQHALEGQGINFISNKVLEFLSNSQVKIEKSHYCVSNDDIIGLYHIYGWSSVYKESVFRIPTCTVDLGFGRLALQWA